MDDVKSVWPLHPGLHTCYNAWYKATRPREGEETAKARPSSDWSLQLDSMKSESLVIPDQQAGVNTFPGLVHTARHTMGVSCSRNGCANPQGGQVFKEWLVTGVKS